MEVHEREVSSPCEGLLVTPVGGGDAAVVVLAGSSGRVERERARILARHGVTALAIRWFGGPGQPAGICEIPLETFTAAVDVLRSAGARRIAVLGVSKGAEAALLTAVHDPRVDVVIAVSPTSRVWCNVGPGRDGRARPYRSSWTWRGEPLPFMPMDDTWTPPSRTADRSPSADGTNTVNGPSPICSPRRRSRWRGRRPTYCSWPGATTRCGPRCPTPRNWPPAVARPGHRRG